MASYLERLREFPVLAQVAPGDLRERLPASPPDRAEPFSAVLRDLDELLLPAVTHWQSPRFFAYFANTGSEPGILAELLIAGLNQVGILWRTSPALQELEEVTLDWLAQLLGLPDGLARPSRGHRLDRDDGGARCGPSGQAGRTRRRLLGACALVRRQGMPAARAGGARDPGRRGFPAAPDQLDLTDACAVVATIGTTSTSSIDPVDAVADACEREGVWLHVDAAYAGSAAVCPGAA